MAAYQAMEGCPAIVLEHVCLVFLRERILILDRFMMGPHWHLPWAVQVTFMNSADRFSVWQGRPGDITIDEAAEDEMMARAIFGQLKALL